jgi:hypothetical protein
MIRAKCHGPIAGSRAAAAARESTFVPASIAGPSVYVNGE